jgi:2-polyprenyl-3-methyl-5-hydroxy-6-metoxy-1,4-benzoquinol methylase
MAKPSGALGVSPRPRVSTPNFEDHGHLLRRIIDAYDSPVIRWYGRCRFVILNINILNMLALCIQGKRRILDIGCGFGLFGCYLKSRYPDLVYEGYDLNERRVATANRVASRLGLTDISFKVGDARQIALNDEFDAIIMLDLMHHIDDVAKRDLLRTCVDHLAPDGRLVIKDVTTHPFPKIAFTWALDVVMTLGFDMWYWNEERFLSMLAEEFDSVELFPIVDWLPYPHVIYLSQAATRNRHELEP